MESSTQLTLWSEGSRDRARTSRWQESVLDWLERGADCGSRSSASLLASAPVGWSSRTFRGFYPLREGKISPPSSGAWPNSGTWGRGGCLTLDTSAWPSEGVECSLSAVLETQPVPQRYFLSPRAASGILRRVEKRGKTLPAPLAAALESVAGPRTPRG